MRIRKNSWATIARLVFRELRRWLFPNDKDDRRGLKKAKGRARQLDCRELPVVGCQPIISGCFLSLLPDVYISGDLIKVFSPDVVPKNGGKVRVQFSEEPNEMLYSIFGHNYKFKIGSYLRVVEVYR